MDPHRAACRRGRRSAVRAYLVYAELFRIDAICLWCSAVHVITALLFGLVCFGTALGVPETQAA